MGILIFLLVLLRIAVLTLIGMGGLFLFGITVPVIQIVGVVILIEIIRFFYF